MIGSDICGFFGNTTEELCNRWIQVGAFAPFSRVHNAEGQKPQELYRWSSVAESARRALSLRYRLLPYMYTLFRDAHTRGQMVAQPLFSAFPGDVQAVAAADQQFMLGDAILITPVLESGATSVVGYFPKGMWYSLVSGQPDVHAIAAGKLALLQTPLTSTNVHVRGGYIAPLQAHHGLQTTSLELVVALDESGQAYGSAFFDDGEQPRVGHDAVSLDLAVKDGLLQVHARSSVCSNWTVPKIHSVRVLGLHAESVSIELNSSSGPHAFITTYDHQSKVLLVSGLDLPGNDGFSLRWVLSGAISNMAASEVEFAGFVRPWWWSPLFPCSAALLGISLLYDLVWKDRNRGNTGVLNEPMM